MDAALKARAGDLQIGTRKTLPRIIGTSMQTAGAVGGRDCEEGGGGGPQFNGNYAFYARLAVSLIKVMRPNSEEEKPHGAVSECDDFSAHAKSCLRFVSCSGRLPLVL
jgi:hypothetical protein